MIGSDYDTKAYRNSYNSEDSTVTLTCIYSKLHLTIFRFIPEHHKVEHIDMKVTQNP